MKSSNAISRLRLLLLTIFAVAAFGGASAQHQHPSKRMRPDKTEWLRKMKEVKHDFLARELNLSAKQRDEFLKIYDEKEEARFKAEREVRKIERELKQKGEKATDADYEKCIEAQYSLNARLAEIEKKYEKAFRGALSKRQLASLPDAERKFQRHLMEQRQNCPPPKP